MPFCQSSVDTIPAGSGQLRGGACSAGVEVTVPLAPVPLQGPVDMGHLERMDTGRDDAREKQGSVSARCFIRCGG